jgi:acyl-coenzyme A synthetase/AMP-(fatty) acid ligase
MLPLTPSGLLASALDVGSRRDALVDGDLRFSYGNLAAAVERASELLRRAGVGPGDRVAHLGRTAAAHVILLFATAQLRAIYAPFDPWVRPNALERLLAVAKPKLLVLGHSLRERRFAVELAQSDWKFPAEIATADATAGSWADALAPSGQADPRVFDTEWLAQAREPHIVLFTSGTTGEPKGVVYSQGAFASQSLIINLGLGMAPTDRYLNVYAAGHFVSLMSAMEMVGCCGCLVQMPVPDPGSVLQIIERERISVLVAVPAIWRSILSHPAASSTDFSSLRMADIASDSIPRDLIVKVMDVTGAVSIQGYGLTEAGLVTLLPTVEARSRLGSAGIPLPFAAVRIVGDDGEPAGPGQEGEIWVRTEYGMTGLWDGERVTPAKRRDDGFIPTGDLGWIDRDGYLTVTGRRGDFLKVSGFRLSIAAIEDALRAHPGCADVAVVAVPLSEGCQAPAALIVPKSSATLRASDLRAWVVAALQPQAAPLWLGVSDSIPKTAGTGKARRREIVEKFQRGDYPLLAE